MSAGTYELSRFSTGCRQGRYGAHQQAYVPLARTTFDYRCIVSAGNPGLVPGSLARLLGIDVHSHLQPQYAAICALPRGSFRFLPYVPK